MTLLDQIKADRMGGLWIVNPDMKSVVTYDDGDIVVHDEYGVMDARELRRIGRVPSMEAALLAAGDLADAASNYVQAMKLPDDLMCCNGHMCGCQGATNHQFAEYIMEEALAAFRSAIEVK